MTQPKEQKRWTKNRRRRAIKGKVCDVRMGVLSMFYIVCDCECGKRISLGLFTDNRTIFNLPRFLFTHAFSLTHAFRPSLTRFSFSLMGQSVLLLLSCSGYSLSCKAFWWEIHCRQAADPELIWDTLQFTGHFPGCSGKRWHGAICLPHDQCGTIHNPHLITMDFNL